MARPAFFAGLHPATTRDGLALSATIRLAPVWLPLVPFRNYRDDAPALRAVFRPATCLGSAQGVPLRRPLHVTAAGRLAIRARRSTGECGIDYHR